MSKSLLCLVTVTFTAMALAGCTSAPTDDGTELVKMQGSAFLPKSLTIEAGTKVVFKNLDGVTHSVTPDDKEQWGTEGSGDDASDWLGRGEEWTFTFDEPGTYTYHCIPHAGQNDDGDWEGMVGTIIVTEAADDGHDDGDAADNGTA